MGISLKIYDVVKNELAKYGITAVRADEKTYTEELWSNICAYMYGCGFGVAIFDRIDEESFNPNVSLEVGYMLGLGKPVLLLKDKSLKSLRTDLVGRLYTEFDTQHPAESISKAIGKWLRDRNIVAS